MGQAAAGCPEMRERLGEMDEERSELLAVLRAGGACAERLTGVERALRDRQSLIW